MPGVRPLVPEGSRFVKGMFVRTAAKGGSGEDVAAPPSKSKKKHQGSLRDLGSAGLG